jgi:hypothetical protein
MTAASFANLCFEYDHNKKIQLHFQRTNLVIQATKVGSAGCFFLAKVQKAKHPLLRVFYREQFC